MGRAGRVRAADDRLQHARLAQRSAIDGILRAPLGTGAASTAHDTRPSKIVAAPERRAILPPMPRDPNVPDEFDVYTLCLLRRPADAPALSEAELDALQAQHLAHRAELQRQGLIVVNGPFADQSDIRLRGMSIFACGIAEAARHNDDDPLVRAGRLSYDLMEWWVGAGTLAFPGFPGPVGDRRAMPDD